LMGGNWPFFIPVLRHAVPSVASVPEPPGW
jgi:hypothetical protein